MNRLKQNFEKVCSINSIHSSNLGMGVSALTEPLHMAMTRPCIGGGTRGPGGPCPPPPD